MNVALQRTAAESAYLDAFAEWRAAPGAPWLDGAREKAFAAFAATGLPHRRVEAWKYTDLRSLIDGAYAPLPEAAPAPAAQVEALLAQDPFAGLDCFRAVCVDGRFAPRLARLEGAQGVELASLAQGLADAPDWLRQALGRTAPREAEVVAALNTAFLADGIAVRIRAGVKLARPLELVFLTTRAERHTTTLRNLVVLEEGAEATVIETWIGIDGAYLTNAMTEVRVGRAARLQRVKVQEEGAGAIHLANLHVELTENANLREVAAAIGARVARSQIFLDFTGRGGDAHLAGATMIAGRQHSDTTLVVNHAVPACTSRELYKCVLDGQARGVFQGKVIVAPDAQKTDGKQQSHALLLSEGAEFDAKPELEIFADDVACGHGATSGQIDADHLFYMRARGIPEDEAKAMLIAAFLDEAFDELGHEGVKEALVALAEGWLRRRKGA